MRGLMINGEETNLVLYCDKRNNRFIAKCEPFEDWDFQADNEEDAWDRAFEMYHDKLCRLMDDFDHFKNAIGGHLAGPKQAWIKETA